MASSIDSALSTKLRGKALSCRVESYTGQVVYIYAFDVAYEVVRKPIRELLGQPVAQFVIDASKRSPRQLFFYRPAMVHLPPLERLGPRGLLRMERTIKLLPVGAISITVRIPFEIERIEDLVDFHDLHFNNGTLHDEIRQLADDVRKELSPYFVRPVQRLSEDEAYTVFCIKAPLSSADGEIFGTEDWLLAHRREVASLLTQEPSVAELSEQESDESTGRYLSYYGQDLCVIDWDAALVIDQPRNWDETLYIMELANLQLAELEAYDRLLDEALDRSYRDLRERQMRSRNRTEVLRELRELRIDLARMNDELSNITKFFGDWHLARIYQSLSARFHLGDWHRAIEDKLRTLDHLYQILQQDMTNRLMIILEATIVLLFIIDLVVLFMGLQK
jgi:hypothetical protein